MKRLLSLLICLSLSLSLDACGGRPAEEGTSSLVENSSSQPSASSPVSQPSPDTPSSSESVPADAPSAAPEAPEAAAAGDGQNILIAYFTWAENTQVADPSAIDVDATTSASVLLPGNAAKIAGWIQERTGGDLFSIVVTEPYSSDYDECLDRAADEKANNARPQLVNHLENMEDYDIVFLGFPNWWYTVPMAVHTFLEEYDFSGKTVIPFVTHGTGGLAGTIRDITADLPDSATVREAISVYRPEVDTAQPAVNAWLDELGFTETTAAASDAGASSGETGERKLVLRLDGREIPVTLYDTPAANALYEMLPLELSFRDFNQVEKISNLPEQLPTEGEPSGCDPELGDLCLYAPWGNLSVFYRDFSYSSGLVLLGKLNSDVETIAAQTADFSATLEIADGN